MIEDNRLVAVPLAEYNRLLYRDKLLTALEDAGVISGEWYSTVEKIAKEGTDEKI